MRDNHGNRELMFLMYAANFLLIVLSMLFSLYLFLKTADANERLSSRIETIRAELASKEVVICTNQ